MFQIPNMAGAGMPQPVTFGIAPAAEAALDRLCICIKELVTGQLLAEPQLLGQDLAVFIGLNSMLPSLPGGKWSGEERDVDGAGLHMLHLRRIDGEELALHRDAAMMPTIGSWCSGIPDETVGAAVFFLSSGPGGWELGLDTGVAPIQRHALGALPPHVNWASPVSSGGVGLGIALIAGAPHAREGEQLIDYLLSTTGEKEMIQRGACQFYVRATTLSAPWLQGTLTPTTLPLADIQYHLEFIQRDLQTIFSR